MTGGNKYVITEPEVWEAAFSKHRLTKTFFARAFRQLPGYNTKYLCTL